MSRSEVARSVDDLPDLVGSSPAMEQVRAFVRKAAKRKDHVLLLGQSGVGKGAAAAAIHRLSRPNSPFVAVNCGTLTENLIESELFGYVRGAFTGAVADRLGMFRAANGGTIFLDEIGELPLQQQVKLLKVLDDGEITPLGKEKPQRVDVRVIAATHRNLLEESDKGRFRKDLYYRLNVLKFTIPPLNEHRTDILELVRKIRDAHGHTRPLTPEALRLVQAAPWPGNVRELENWLKLYDTAPEDAVSEIQAASRPTPIIGPSEDVPDLDPSEEDHVRRLGRAVDELRALGPSMQKCDINRVFERNGLEAPHSQRDFAYELHKHWADLTITSGVVFSEVVERWLVKLGRRSVKGALPRQDVATAIRASDTTSAPPRSGDAAPADIGQGGPLPLATNKRSTLVDIIIDRTARRIGAMDALEVERNISQSVEAFERAPQRFFVVVDQAGSGKSVLCDSIVRRRVRQDLPTILVRGSEINCAASGAIPSIESAILSGYPELQAAKSIGAEGAESARLWSYLCQIPEMMIVLDAVNESGIASEKIAKELETIVNTMLGLRSEPVLRLLITCRTEYWHTCRRLQSVFIEGQGRRLLYRCWEAAHHPAKQGSGPVSPTPGVYTDREFDCAWELYTKSNHVIAYPRGAARLALRNPLLLRIFCETMRDQHVGEFAELRFWDVLRIYAIHNLRLAERLLLGAQSHVDGDWLQVLEISTMEYAWATYRAQRAFRLAEAYEHFVRCFVRYGPIGSGALAQELAIRGVEALVVVGTLRRDQGEQVTFAFERLSEMCAGRWVARRIWRDAPERIEELVERMRAGDARAREVLRFTILEREVIDRDFTELLYRVATSGSEGAMLACQVVGDLEIVRNNPALRNEVIYDGLSQLLCESQRLSRLLGLGHYVSSGSDQLAQARVAEIERVMRSGIEPLRTSPDQVFRFSLVRTIRLISRRLRGDLALRRIPSPVESLIVRWLQSDSRDIFGQTVALAVASSTWTAEIARQVMAIAMDTASAFGTRRTAVLALLEATYAQARAYGPSSSAVVQLHALLFAAKPSPSDTLRRAVWLEIALYAHGALHQVPEEEIRAWLEARPATWVTVSGLLALRDLLRFHPDADYVKHLYAWVSGIDFPESEDGATTPEAAACAWLRTAIHPEDTGVPRIATSARCTEGDTVVVFAPEILGGSTLDHHECRERVYAALDGIKAGFGSKKPTYHIVSPVGRDELTGSVPGWLPIHEPDYVDAALRGVEAPAWRSDDPAEMRCAVQQAGRYSAGMALTGVRSILEGRVRTVLCPGRPPGHLAGNPICLFDNVSIGAMEARACGKRVLILDADAHYGRHIQRTFLSDKRVFCVSLHESDLHVRDGFVHQIGRWEIGQDQQEHDGLGATLNLPLERNSVWATSAGYRTLVARYVLPAARAFAPDIVIVALGSDALADDRFSNLQLDVSALADTVHSVCTTAKLGALVAMEGGYDLAGLEEVWAEVTRRLVSGLPPAEDTVDHVGSRYLALHVKVRPSELRHETLWIEKFPGGADVRGLKIGPDPSWITSSPLVSGDEIRGWDGSKGLLLHVDGDDTLDWGSLVELVDRAMDIEADLGVLAWVEGVDGSVEAVATVLAPRTTPTKWRGWRLAAAETRAGLPDTIDDAWRRAAPGPVVCWPETTRVERARVLVTPLQRRFK